MGEAVTLSNELSDAEWLSELDEIGEERGYFTPLGKDHFAVFVDESPRVLLISFETLSGIRATNDTGMPLGFSLAEIRGWSHLGIVAKSDTWFRAPEIWGYFDRLVDEGFFEDFDRVIFYGAGMCGYAAAAYSVAAPGATVVAISPQATLDPRIAGWDSRFRHMRRIDFTRRYGYAPDMLDACEQAYVIYDPGHDLDAMHAALFARPGIHRIRYRRDGGSSVDADFRAMKLLGPIFDKAAEDALTPLAFHRILRARRSHGPWLRALLARLVAADRLLLIGIFCRAVLRERNSPRFRHHLELAEHKLMVQGKTLPAAAPARPRPQLADTGAPKD